MHEANQERLGRLIRRALTASAGVAAVGGMGTSAQAVTASNPVGLTVFDSVPNDSLATTLDLDFDGDTVDDLRFGHEYTANIAGDQIYTSVDGLGGTSYFVVPILFSSIPINYALNSPIDGSDVTETAEKGLASTDGAGPTNGPFATGGYLGFQLGSGQLGWLRIDIAPVTDAEPNKVILGAWALAGPGEGILAGTTTTFALAGPAPEPAALGGLALLAVGAAAVRRRKH